jgi:hypothetical protein
MTATSREIVQNGVATFFGGPAFDNNSRSYRGSIPAALATAGLSVVRAHQPKRVNDNDYVLTTAMGGQQSPGRGMGAYMVVQIPDDIERKRTIPIIVGRKWQAYRVVLHVFHLAHKAYAEDAEADVNGVVEAIKDYMRADPTLGGICYQAGISPYGIRTKVPQSTTEEKEVTATHAEISFEVEVMIID